MNRKSIQGICAWATVYQTLLLGSILGVIDLSTVQAQQPSPSKHMFRLHLDNDFFVYRKEDGAIRAA